MEEFKNLNFTEIDLMHKLSNLTTTLDRKIRFGSDWNETPPGINAKTRLESLTNEMNDVIVQYNKLLNEVLQDLKNESDLNCLENQTYEG
jgi:hypothetical protein